jgi:hypothetical protein
MRVAGTTYQFRHREIQDFLARNPKPFRPGVGPLAPR